ncbi:HEAT repeat domain-containing protein [Synechococcus sp. CS-602]|nr:MULTISPECIES: HEAT repeat domain-containing protein [unclassified Synechococcus]MCT0201492.1 HEAT repeat domain-containing protein [Synechococcus sp. CS-603]MCT0205999.1 HEAT repeat domain-containing protein [Synechococcus sp. CS-602]MCT0244923.1 HEAT repeat domain-containing protein [Synechococcus sp. CS-601]MCT4364434.1 HEAT repeat domain-containing protein [Candidatus Regnicoccus frigidus MAG-AL1]MCT4366662.1 HEAT repeat domain-containing protein [Candidatus Regnicoccus frigidus MAG-AL2]
MERQANSELIGSPISEDEALRRLGLTDDASSRYYAAWWLGRHRSDDPRTITLLLEALRQRSVHNPDQDLDATAVARNAARALGKLGQAAHQAIPDLLRALDDDDPGLREAAARALGNLGAREAVEPLARRLKGGPAGPGRAQQGSARLVEPCEALLEALGELGVANSEVLEVITPFLDHERPVVSNAAARALLQLTGQPCWGERLVAMLRHPQLQVRRSALLDIGACGWLPALGPICATLAENSLKLIALRGLAEAAPSPGSAEAVLTAMDDLL